MMMMFINYIRWRLKLEGETENMGVCTKEPPRRGTCHSTKLWRRALLGRDRAWVKHGGLTAVSPAFFVKIRLRPQCQHFFVKIRC